MNGFVDGFDESPLERAVREQSESRELALEGREDYRRARGIVHTPAPLARFMVRHLDERLKEVLSLEHGIADPRVTLVDPACGTGVFFSAALDLIKERARRPRALVGFELDRSAIDACAAALSEESEAAGVPLLLEAKNTLESLTLPIEADVVCVLGNPPWSGKSANRGLPLTDALLEDFKKLSGGAPLDERKIGVLSDDYIRFMRWSAELVRRAKGGGAMALVTNGSFLDGPVHRGIRAALLRWFTELDLVDLGGSALVSKGEECDENVFGVRPKVACAFALRRGDHGELVEAARLRYARLYGSRAEKLARLGARSPVFQRFEAREPQLIFERAEWSPDFPQGWRSLEEWIPFHQEGVQTNRDEAIIAPDRETLRQRLERFARGEPDEALSRALIPSDHYDPARAADTVRELIREGSLEDFIKPIAYRPFDDRFFFAHRALCHRPRPKLLAAAEHSEFILVSVRKDRGSAPYRHFAITRHIPDNSYLSPRSSCRSRAFPPFEASGRENIAPAYKEIAARVAGRDVSAVEIFYYIASFLASPRYQDYFSQRLRRDYPKIPLPHDGKIFEERVSIGERVKDAFLGSRDLDINWTLGHHHLIEKSEALELAQAECDSLLEMEWGAHLTVRPLEAAT